MFSFSTMAPPAPKNLKPQITREADIEGPWGTMKLRLAPNGDLTVVSHTDPEGRWSDDGGGQHAILSVINDCRIVELKPGGKRPCLPFPNCFLDFLVAHAEFVPEWMKKANAVFFYELNPPPNHEGGSPMVRGISFASGKARLELRLDRAFGTHDRVGMFWSDDPMEYSLFDR
jgi:hypothetical protein